MNKPLSRTLWIAVLAVPAACTTDQGTSGQDVATTTPNAVALSITGHTFTAPDTIDAGWTTFRFANHGDDIHYAHIVRVDSGRTVQDLVDGYAAAIRTSGPRPKWIVRFGGPGGAAPHDSANVTERLEPGNYVWICPIEDSTGTPHFVQGEHRTFVVRPTSTDSAAPPVATATIRLMDYGFTVDSAIRAGQHTIRVENVGQDGHDLVLMKLAPGRTAEDVRRAMNPERARRPDEKDQPPVPFESLGTGAGGIAAIRSGMAVYFTTALTPGEYALVCMATAPDGRSHIEHGMIQQIRVQ